MINQKSDFFLKFCGGVDEVTGANFLFSLPDRNGQIHKILIDCGMTQGSQSAYQKNYSEFSFNPKEIETLFVTHAHIDHIGRIPKLVKDGFKGRIISTPETMELSRLMLEDAERVMADESRENGVLPFYEKSDLENSFLLWQTLPYHETFEIAPDVSVVAKDAGHVLGSAMYEFNVRGEKIVFTGDLGNSPSPLLRDTESILGANYLVMESVYGNRNHESKEDRRAILKRILLENIKRNGALLIPIFSLEKTQVILYEMNSLVESGEVPAFPVFLDSPLAIKVTEVYKKHKNLFNDSAKNLLSGGDDIFHFPKLRLTLTNNESDSIVRIKGAKVIIAGSGMSTGGRITKHERIYLGNSANSILFVGYQSAGSLGRQIEEGMKRVKINDEYVEVRARVEKIVGYSSHKEMDGLLSFVEEAVPTLKKVFVVMGEPGSAFFLANRIRDYFDIDAFHPEEGETYYFK